MIKNINDNTESSMDLQNSDSSSTTSGEEIVGMSPTFDPEPPDYRNILGSQLQ